MTVIETTTAYVIFLAQVFGAVQKPIYDSALIPRHSLQSPSRWNVLDRWAASREHACS
jgi:hypothetical protein